MVWMACISGELALRVECCEERLRAVLRQVVKYIRYLQLRNGRLRKKKIIKKTHMHTPRTRTDTTRSARAEVRFV